MKHATVVSAVLVLVAGGCKKERGDAKKQESSAKPTEAKTEPKAEEPAKTEARKAQPLDDAQCKDVVLAIVACRSSGSMEANVAFDDWLLNRFYGGTGIALLDPLQEEMNAWTADPARTCESWVTSPGWFADGTPIHAAAKAGDCAALRASIDASGGIPMPPEENAVPLGDPAPLTKAECKSLVTELAACGTAKDASHEYRVWLVENVFNAFDDPSWMKLLDEELARWKKSPAKICKEWNEYEGDLLTWGDAIRPALAAHDCAALRTAITGVGGLPMPADD